jgi:hypothetical protein
MAHREAVEACPERTEIRTETDQEPIKAEMKIGLVEAEAADLGANPEEKEAMAKQQEVPNEDAAVETIRALNDWSGDRHLAVRRHGQLKKWTHGGCRSWQKLVVA